MQKGIGAAPFAIVAALIVALTVGFWVTQPAHAAAGDVVIAVDDVDVGTFIDPGGAADTANNPFGPAGLAHEIRGSTTNPLEAAYGKTAANAFRGANDRGAWVEVAATVRDSDTDDTSRRDGAFTIQITVSGEASLSSSSTLTTATCTAQGATDSACEFAVYGSGNAGDFTIEGAPGAGDLLTADAVKKAGSINGQWVGQPTQATVLTAGPAESAKTADVDGDATTQFGSISPASFLSGTLPGLELGEVGFLFQLSDDGGRVALSTETGAATANENTRNDLRVRVLTDAGDPLTLAAELSNSVTGAAAGATVYVDIRQEGGLGDAYPAVAAISETQMQAGGLIAVGISQEAGDLGDAALGRIVLDLAGGGSIEHAFAIAGHPDADMTTVSGPGTPVNLKPGAEHTRSVTLRDANGTPISLPANGAADADAATVAAELSARGVITPAETGTDGNVDLLFSVADAKSDSPGVYVVTITANSERFDDSDPPVQVEGSRDATLGSHAFEITIDNLANADPFKETADADGNPLEARVAGAITALSVTSVTNLAGDEILMAGSEVTVNAYDLITITLTATEKDGGAPYNGSEVTPLAGTGFVGAGDSATNNPLETDDAGEVTVDFRAGTASQNLGFRAGSVAAQLLVRIVTPGAEADEGPSVYSLVGSAGSTYVSWNGGDASSSVFENVAGLVIVWKWTGSMWVGYTSSPSAPAATKTVFGLSDGDVLYVVSNGPVDVELD
ncbi:MAG: hypothetical protein OXG38_09875 [Chloroflexi bacterium]|nr:hypothetical protein [Chloroflexota bacterium]